MFGLSNPGSVMVKFTSVKSAKYYMPLIYIVVGIAWILLSDSLLLLIKDRSSTGLYNFLNSAKGVCYVVITGLLLGILITRSARHLLKGEQHFRNLYLSNPYPIWFFDPLTYKFLSVNDAAISTYGYTREEFLSMTVFNIHPAVDVDSIKQYISRVSGQEYQFSKWSQIKKDGSPVYVHVSSLLTSMNEKQAVMLLVIDISERVSYEQNLAKSRVHLESTLSSISDSFFTINTDWIVTKANANFYERTGISEEVIGKPIKHIFPDADGTMMFQAAARAMSEGIPTKIEAYYHPLSKWLHVACYPTEEGIAVYFTDITERKEKEAEIMRQNEQLRKVSWLNSHELRKPVASILSLVDLLKVSSNQKETLQIIERIKKCTIDLDDLVHQINEEASKI